jgi:hypothetical protein
MGIAPQNNGGENKEHTGNSPVRECQAKLPPGWYIAAWFWDIESGGLPTEVRGHGSAHEQFAGIDAGDDGHPAHTTPNSGGQAHFSDLAQAPIHLAQAPIQVSCTGIMKSPPLPGSRTPPGLRRGLPVASDSQEATPRVIPTRALSSRSKIVGRRVLGDHCIQHELDAVAQMSDHGSSGFDWVLSCDGLKDGPVCLVGEEHPAD